MHFTLHSPSIVCQIVTYLPMETMKEIELAKQKLSDHDAFQIQAK